MPYIRRHRIAEILDVSHNTDRIGRVVDIVLITLILLNVLAIVLESILAFERQYATFFYVFEVFSIAIFTVEYVLRVWSCVDRPEAGNGKPTMERLRYMVSPTALIDLIAIAPFYLAFFVPLDLRFLRVVRLFRMFKLTRYSAAMGILLEVLQEESRSFLAAFFVLFILLVIASSGIYLIERDIQPNAFGSIPAAMWWAMATLTTVGYGDITPITSIGKFFGGFITVIGMGMVALPAGILASGFAENLHRRRTQYDVALGRIIEQGVISENERWQLESLRKAMNLSAKDAQLMFDMMARQNARLGERCPHCGERLHSEEG